MNGIAAASLSSACWPIIIGIVVAWGLAAITVYVHQRRGVLVTAGLGLGSSIYLITQKYSENSACSEGGCELFNCDEVNQSIYSSVGPLPVATFGAAFFLAVLYVSWRAVSKPDEHPLFPRFVLLSGLAATGASAVMATISFGIIGQICPFCVSLYGLSLILLWAGWRVTAEGGGGVVQRLKPTRAEGAAPDASLSSAMGTFMLGLVAFYFAFRPAADATPVVGEVISNIELVGDEPSKGSAEGPYIVMEFADFQCGSCAAMHPEMDALVRENSDIGLIFKHYPLTEIHPQAFLAAKATVCADQQGEFWPMSDLVFANLGILVQDNCDDPSSSLCSEKMGRKMQFFAGQLEMNTGAFTACMNQDATAARVQQDIDLGESLELRGTPSLFLLGVKGEGEWVQVEGRGAAVLALVKAHREGAALPVASTETEGSADH